MSGEDYHAICYFSFEAKITEKSKLYGKIDQEIWERAKSLPGRLQGRLSKKVQILGHMECFLDLAERMSAQALRESVENVKSPTQNLLKAHEAQKRLFRMPLLCRVLRQAGQARTPGARVRYMIKICRDLVVQVFQLV